MVTASLIALGFIIGLVVGAVGLYVWIGLFLARRFVSGGK